MAEDKSIIDPKYRDRYKTGGDWIKSFIDGLCYDQKYKTVSIKDEDGEDTGDTKEVPAGRPVLDLDKLFSLAAINGIDAEGKYGDQRDRKNAPGRLRMTIGNMLRAAALRRHGLNDLDGNFVDAPAEFVGNREKSENPDGSKIKSKKEKEKEKEAA